MTPFFEISAVLAIATILAGITHALRLPFILAYVLTGILVGPAGFHLVRSQDTLTVFSQLGVTALLFLVGLNLSPKVMREVGRVSAMVATVQMACLFAIAYGIASWFGHGGREGIFVAFAVSFASTIIATKWLSDKKDLELLYGKIAIGILLVQDVVATGALIVLSSHDASVWTWDAFFFSAGKILSLLLALYLFQRLVMERLLRWAATAQEYLFVFAFAWGLGVAALFAAVGWSLEIGALVAGVILASSPYHFEIRSKMRIVRDLFLTLFFVFLGYQVTVDAGAMVGPVILFALLVACISPFVTFILLTAYGYAKKTAFMTGITLSAMSEFSFLLLLVGRRSGQVGPEAFAIVAVAGLASMVLSSLLMAFADPLYRRLMPLLSWFERNRPVREDRPRKKIDVILFGCHRVGQDFLPVLRRLKRPYLVVDFDPEVIRSLRTERIPCRYGDAEDHELLDEMHLASVKLIVTTVPDLETNLFLIAKAKAAHSWLLVIAVASSAEEAMVLYQAGAEYVIMPHYLGGNYASLLLDQFGLDRQRFEQERGRHVTHLMARLRQKVQK